MQADDFRQDRYGVVSGLRDGGYSDDMTLAAIAGNILISSFSQVSQIVINLCLFLLIVNTWIFLLFYFIFRST